MALYNGKMAYKGDNYNKYIIEKGDSLSAILKRMGFKDWTTSWKKYYDLEVNNPFRSRFPDPNKIDYVKSVPFCIPTKDVSLIFQNSLPEKQSITVVTAQKNTTVVGHWGEIKHYLSQKLSTGSTLVNRLMDVKWQGIAKTEGLKGDWHFLWMVWFLELSPSNLGVWSNDNSLVTITSMGYIEDLRGKARFKDQIGDFKAEYPDLTKIKIKDVLHSAKGTPGVLFQFTGAGTATGNYNAVEWFLGSYLTTMEVVSVNLTKKIVQVRVAVSNMSHWQSGTRIPQVGQNFGLPKYLITNDERNQFGPGGNFNQKFVWQEDIQY